MKAYIRHTLLIFVALICSMHIKAQSFDPDIQMPPIELSEESEFYLVTCHPGSEVYELFGHTGLRLIDPMFPYFKLDVIYHYGIFDAFQNHFLIQFCKGNAKYELGCWPWELFIFQYVQRQSAITQNKLNLTRQQRQQLFDALRENDLPQNKKYTYNFVYDNCATRPFDIVLRACNLTLLSPDNESFTINDIHHKPNYNTNYQHTRQSHDNKALTYRNIIEECTSYNTWLKFGIDIALGAHTDRIIEYQHTLGFPFYLHDEMLTYNIVSTNGEQPILAPDEWALQYPEHQKPTSGLLNPILICTLWLIIVALVTLIQYRHNTYHCWIDIFQNILTGLFGIIITALWAWSNQPLTECNYNILWLNPLMIVFAILLCFEKTKGKMRWYALFQSALCIAALLVLIFNLQQLHAAAVPIIVALFIRYLYYLIYYK